MSPIIKISALLILLWGLMLMGGVAGWRAGALSKRAMNLIAVSLCLLLVAGAWFGKHLSWLPEWMISPYAAYFQCTWFAPPAAALFMLGGRHAREQELLQTETALAERPVKRTARRQLFVLSLLTITILIGASIPLLGPPKVEVRAGRAQNGLSDEDGVVRQSTDSTCGASACATLLRRLDIVPEATEKQLVPLCMTRLCGGATTLGLAVGLKSIAAPLGWHVRIIEPDWPVFQRLRMPVVCAIHFSAFIDHAVVVCQVDPERGVQLADPLRGLVWESEEDFREVFKNEVISVFRNDPFENE